MRLLPLSIVEAEGLLERDARELKGFEGSHQGSLGRVRYRDDQKMVARASPKIGENSREKRKANSAIFQQDLGWLVSLFIVVSFC